MSTPYKTRDMKFEEIRKIMSDYIEKYSTKRIQKRLQLKTSVKASTMQFNV